MRPLLLVSLLASLALAQSRPSRDAGVVLDVKKPAQAVDAGVPSAGVVDRAAGAEVERLKKEVLELKTRLAEVERAQQQKSDSLAGDLQRLSRQVDELKGQLEKVSQAEERRANAENTVAEQRAATATASSNLGAALTQLSTGATSGVEASLRYAEATYSGNAQKLVQLARSALANGDLNNARMYLVLAISEANAQR